MLFRGVSSDNAHYNAEWFMFGWRTAEGWFQPPPKDLENAQREENAPDGDPSISKGDGRPSDAPHGPAPASGR